MAGIRISGRARLREDFSNPKNVRYYAVLDVYADEERQASMPTPNFIVEVLLAKSTYDKLRKDLEESQAQSPVLRLKGELEIVLDSESFA
ncbi:MAG: hypothetical protein WC796_00225 [Candidatus Pacearchaeota archaeon]|jgi:hypothetical protein